MRRWALALLLLTPLSAQAETRYISDELAVPLRRGPSNQHRILHAGLPSGTALEVLAQDDGGGFTQVRTPNGTEGFVPTQFLVVEPVAKDRLVAANRRIESLTAELTTLRQNLKTEQAARGGAQATVSELEKKVRELQTDLAEIRRVSADTVAQYEENKALKTQNAELQQSVATQAGEIRTLKSNEVRVWLLIGGGLVVLGLIFGVAIKSRPKGRSGW
jgi:SH3 domain protein